MNQETLISVIIPIYNIKNHLERCVQSVQNQTYRNLEIILVDDGSTDGTSELCEQLAEHDARIRVFHKENGGSSSARNLGIRQARGEYMGFVDSDDYIEPAMYEILMRAVIRSGCSIAQGIRDEIDEDGQKLPDIVKVPEEEICYSAEGFLKELLLHKGDCSFCTKLIRSELLEGREFPEGALNEDFHLLVKLLADGHGVYLVRETVYHVFYRMDSNTRKISAENFSRVYSDNIDNADMVLKLTQERFPVLEKVAIRFGLFQRLDYLLHIPISRMNGENVQYQKAVRFLRQYRREAAMSPYLTKKNKLYLLLLSIAPRNVRRLHKCMNMHKCMQR